MVRCMRRGWGRPGNRARPSWQPRETRVKDARPMGFLSMLRIIVNPGTRQQVIVTWIRFRCTDMVMGQAGKGCDKRDAEPRIRRRIGARSRPEDCADMLSTRTCHHLNGIMGMSLCPTTTSRPPLHYRDVWGVRPPQEPAGTGALKKLGRTGLILPRNPSKVPGLAGL